MEYLIGLFAVLLFAGVIVWRIDRFVAKWQQIKTGSPELAQEQKRLELEERRQRVELDEATAVERVEFARAELLRQTAEAKMAALVIEDTQADRVAAESRMIAARADAACELADEFARDENALRLSKLGESDDDIVEAYGRYLSYAAANGVSSVHDFEDFAKILRNQ